MATRMLQSADAQARELLAQIAAKAEARRAEEQAKKTGTQKPSQPGTRAPATPAGENRPATVFEPSGPRPSSIPPPPSPPRVVTPTVMHRHKHGGGTRSSRYFRSGYDAAAIGSPDCAVDSDADSCGRESPADLARASSSGEKRLASARSDSDRRLGSCCSRGAEFIAGLQLPSNLLKAKLIGGRFGD